MLTQAKLYTIEVLVSKILVDLNISLNEFMPMNNVLKEYDNMKEKRKNSNNIKIIFIVVNVYSLQKIKIKRKIDRKISIYSCCIDCRFKKTSNY